MKNAILFGWEILLLCLPTFVWTVSTMILIIGAVGPFWTLW